MNHAMIDCETLSLEPTACVISIGVAIFNDSEVIDSDGWAIDPRWWHGHIDPGTVAWWADPDRDGARELSFTGKHTDFDAAFYLKTFLAKHNADEMWANDPEFDMVVLKQWWKRIGYNQVPGRAAQTAGDFPMHYKKSRSYRTINAEAQRLGHDTRAHWGNCIAHNPVEDAVSQARVVVAARKMLGGALV